MCRWSGLKSKNKLTSLCVTSANHRWMDLPCHPGFVSAGMKQHKLSRCCRFRRKQNRKWKNEPRSLFRDERLQAVFLYLHPISVRSTSIMLCLLPARYFHPCCSLGLNLFEYLSLCFRGGSLGNKMQISVSCGTRCTALSHA